MLEILANTLIALWLTDLVFTYTLAGFIHLLLVIAVVMILLRIIQARRMAWSMPQYKVYPPNSPEKEPVRLGLGLDA